MWIKVRDSEESSGIRLVLCLPVGGSVVLVKNCHTTNTSLHQDHLDWDFTIRFYSLYFNKKRVKTEKYTLLFYIYTNYFHCSSFKKSRPAFKSQLWMEWTFAVFWILNNHLQALLLYIQQYVLLSLCSFDFK